MAGQEINRPVGCPEGSWGSGKGLQTCSHWAGVGCVQTVQMSLVWHEGKNTVPTSRSLSHPPRQHACGQPSVHGSPDPLIQTQPPGIQRPLLLFYAVSDTRTRLRSGAQGPATLHGRLGNLLWEFSCVPQSRHKVVQAQLCAFVVFWIWAFVLGWTVP